MLKLLFVEILTPKSCCNRFFVFDAQNMKALKWISYACAECAYTFRENCRFSTAKARWRLLFDMI